MSNYDEFKRTPIFYAACAIILVAILWWKAGHPNTYFSFGCDAPFGWHEWRPVN
jgi:hypothetical protein